MTFRRNYPARHVVKAPHRNTVPSSQIPIAQSGPRFIVAYTLSRRKRAAYQDTAFSILKEWRDVYAVF
jgi:hypothetical protein